MGSPLKKSVLLLKFHEENGQLRGFSHELAVAGGGGASGQRRVAGGERAGAVPSSLVHSKVLHPCPGTIVPR